MFNIDGYLPDHEHPEHCCMLFEYTPDGSRGTVYHIAHPDSDRCEEFIDKRACQYCDKEFKNCHMTKCFKSYMKLRHSLEEFDDN